VFPVLTALLALTHPLVHIEVNQVLTLAITQILVEFSALLGDWQPGVGI
jgi:hypothetical protein